MKGNSNLDKPVREDGRAAGLEAVPDVFQRGITRFWGDPEPGVIRGKGRRKRVRLREQAHQASRSVPRERGARASVLREARSKRAAA